MKLPWIGALILLTLPLSAEAAPYRFAARAGLGLPMLLGLRLEARLVDPLYLQVGAGYGLLPASAELGLWLRPDVTCWGCEGPNAFALGFGLTGLLFVQDFDGEGMAAAGVDAQYLRRLGEATFLTVGSRAGLGLAWEPGSGRGPEPALDLVLIQAGIGF